MKSGLCAILIFLFVGQNASSQNESQCLSTRAEVHNVLNRIELMLKSRNKEKEYVVYPHENISPYLIEIRKAAANSGEEGQSLMLIAELSIFQLAGIAEPKELLPTIINEIQPSSPAWGVIENYQKLYCLLASKFPRYLNEMILHGDPIVKESLTEAKAELLLLDGRIADAESQIKDLKKFMKNSCLIENYKKQLAKQRNLGIGCTAPSFRISSLDGKHIYTNENFKGRFLLLSFWDNWCNFDEIDSLHILFNQFHAKGFSVLSVSTAFSPKMIGALRRLPRGPDRQTRPMPWDHAFAGRFDHPDRDPILRSFEIERVPCNFLISPDGHILARGRDLQGNEIENTVRKIFQSVELVQISGSEL